MQFLRYCPRIKRKFQFIVVPSILGIATAGLIFQFLYFLPTFDHNPSLQYLFQTSCLAFYLMCFFSYYRAVTITNKLPETLFVPRQRHQLRANHPLYTEKKTCDKQNGRYKPPRTSHCHTCSCVARMDHHCPYTNGCIGANNLKAFILFCFYGGIYALQFLVLSIVFYFKLKAGTVTLSEKAILFWMILNFFAVLLTFSMNGLWISNLTMAAKNITQLELLKGVFSFRDQDGTHPNPYDLGPLSNLNTIFRGDYWLFWWPSQTIHEHDGTQFPMRPSISLLDLKDLPENIQEQLKDSKQKNVPKSIEEIYEKYEAEFENVIFFYLGKQYRITPKEIKEQLLRISQEVDENEKDMNLIGGEQGNKQNKIDIEEQMRGLSVEQKELLEGLYADDNNL